MLRLGMIPLIYLGQVEIAGNPAGTGAIMVLSDPLFLNKAIGLVSRMITVDLAGDENFQEIFVHNLSFPSLLMI